MEQAKELLRQCLEELRLIRSKDGAGPYDPTLKSRVEIFLSSCEDCGRLLKPSEKCYCNPIYDE